MYFKQCNHRTLKRKPKQEKYQSCILATLQLDPSCLPTKTKHYCSTCIYISTISQCSEPQVSGLIVKTNHVWKADSDLYSHICSHLCERRLFWLKNFSLGSTVHIAQKYYRRKPSNGKVSSVSNHSKDINSYYRLLRQENNKQKKLKWNTPIWIWFTYKWS